MRKAKQEATQPRRYLGSEPCEICKAHDVRTIVRLYDWWPEAILCVKHQLEIARAEAKQVSEDA